MGDSDVQIGCRLRLAAASAAAEPLVLHFDQAECLSANADIYLEKFTVPAINFAGFCSDPEPEAGDVSA